MKASYGRIPTYTRATVIAADNISRWTGTRSSIRGSMTAVLTAQRSTSPDTWTEQKSNRQWIWTLKVSLKEDDRLTSCICTDCSCGWQWCWFHPLHQDSQLCRHTTYPLGYIFQKMGRAIHPGNIPVGHYLQKTWMNNPFILKVKWSLKNSRA